MIKLVSSLIGGAVGAVALNVIHESYRQVDADAPRVQQVGEEAITKLADGMQVNPPAGKALYATTLAADLASNALYYSLAGIASRRKLVACGAALGVAAGIGALCLTRPMGLNDEPVNRTGKTQLLTVAWYTIGGLVAGWCMRSLRERS